MHHLSAQRLNKRDERESSLPPSVPAEWPALGGGSGHYITIWIANSIQGVKLDPGEGVQLENQPGGHLMARPAPYACMYIRIYVRMYDTYVCIYTYVLRPKSPTQSIYYVLFKFCFAREGTQGGTLVTSLK